MRFTQAFVALVVSGLASAQLPDIPSCSTNCFIDALTSDGCSSLTDFACHCQKPELVKTVTPCVRKACGVEEQSSVSSIVVSQCSEAGHPISVPPVNGASPTSLSGRSDEASSAPAIPTSSGSEGSASSTPGAGASSSNGIPSSSGSVPSSSASPSSPAFTGAASNMKSDFAGAAAVAAVAAVAACAM